MAGGNSHANYFYQLHFFFKSKKTIIIQEHEGKERKKGLRAKRREKQLETGVSDVARAMGKMLPCTRPSSHHSPSALGCVPPQSVRSVFSLGKRSKNKQPQ